MYDVQVELCRLGFLNNKYIDGFFNIETEKSIKKYQLKNSYTPNGILDDELINSIIGVRNLETIESGKYSRKIYQTAETKVNDKYIKNADAFFNDGKDSELRKGNTSIRIKYAEVGETIIQDVKYRSVGRQFNTSGEAIYEVYEFIARDILE